MIRGLVVTALLAWTAIGGLGAFSYGHDYNVYRGFPPPHESSGVAPGRLVHVDFWSPALQQRRYYVIYLPPGYAQAAARGVRFPVLYLLHAPPGHPENYALAGAMTVRYDELLARHRIHPFLIALPNGRTGSYGSDTEWANAAAGPYENFLLDTVHAVDRRWSTLQSRRARMIAGLSEGGYGATNAALHHPKVFGSFESWGGYYLQEPTGVFAGEPRSVLERNSPIPYVVSHTSALRRLPLRGFVYQGNHDDVPAPAMFRFAALMRATGSTVHAAVYGGGHNWRLLRRHFPQMLRYASRALARPRVEVAA
jgi:enterochelin esterase-like enzyme